MKREEIIRDLVERSSGAGAGQYISIRCDVAREIVALLKEQDETIASLQSMINKLNEAIQNAANQKTPEETEIPQEILEGCKRNKERLRQKVNELYDELISAKRAEIERLKAEIAKMPPLNYEKLAKNPPTYPVKFGIACGLEPPKEEVVVS